MTTAVPLGLLFWLGAAFVFMGRGTSQAPPPQARAHGAEPTPPLPSPPPAAAALDVFGKPVLEPQQGGQRALRAAVELPEEKAAEETEAGGVSRTVITAHTKLTVPTFVYGTVWKKEKTTALVLQAIQAGFRAIDTANQQK